MMSLFALHNFVVKVSIFSQ